MAAPAANASDEWWENEKLITDFLSHHDAPAGADLTQAVMQIRAGLEGFQCVREAETVHQQELLELRGRSKVPKELCSKVPWETLGKAGHIRQLLIMTKDAISSLDKDIAEKKANLAAVVNLLKASNGSAQAGPEGRTKEQLDPMSAWSSLDAERTSLEEAKTALLEQIAVLIGEVAKHERYWRKWNSAASTKNNSTSKTKSTDTGGTQVGPGADGGARSSTKVQAADASGEPDTEFELLQKWKGLFEKIGQGIAKYVVLDSSGYSLDERTDRPDFTVRQKGHEVMPARSLARSYIELKVHPNDHVQAVAQLRQRFAGWAADRMDFSYMFLLSITETSVQLHVAFTPSNPEGENVITLMKAETSAESSQLPVLLDTYKYIMSRHKLCSTDDGVLEYPLPDGLKHPVVLGSNLRDSKKVSVVLADETKADGDGVALKRFPKAQQEAFRCELQNLEALSKKIQLLPENTFIPCIEPNFTSEDTLVLAIRPRCVGLVLRNQPAAWKARTCLLDLLDSMHEQAKLAHLDISPSNIVMRPKSKTATAYGFIDFAASQSLEACEITCNVTTLQYASEVVLNAWMRDKPLSPDHAKAGDRFALTLSLLSVRCPFPPELTQVWKAFKNALANPNGQSEFDALAKFVAARNKYIEERSETAFGRTTISELGLNSGSVKQTQTDRAVSPTSHDGSVSVDSTLTPKAARNRRKPERTGTTDRRNLFKKAD